jgi:hypothetical protein
VWAPTIMSSLAACAAGPYSAHAIAAAFVFRDRALAVKLQCILQIEDITRGVLSCQSVCHGATMPILQFATCQRYPTSEVQPGIHVASDDQATICRQQHTCRALPSHPIHNRAWICACRNAAAQHMAAHDAGLVPLRPRKTERYKASSNPGVRADCHMTARQRQVNLLQWHAAVPAGAGCQGQSLTPMLLRLIRHIASHRGIQEWV